MDNNFIKDERVFPEEMQTFAHNTNIQNQGVPTTQNNKRAKIFSWFLIVLLLIGIGFLLYRFIKKGDDQKPSSSEEAIIQQQRKEMLSEFTPSNQHMSEQERLDRLNAFFAQ